MTRATEGLPTLQSTSTIPSASMTTFAPRPPLQQLDNPHNMSQLSSGRRTSVRLAKKDNTPNIDKYAVEPASKNQIATEGKASKSTSAAASEKTGYKRKAAYDEEDDGFMFSRTRSKKSKPAPVEPVIREEPLKEEPVQPAPKAKPRKKSFSSPTTANNTNGINIEKRRPARHSSEPSSNNTDGLIIKKRRKPRDSAEAQQEAEDNPFKPKRTIPRSSAEGVDRDPPLQISFDATKIALPFADTPIIRRNKEMRKGTSNGSRRSSLGNRGRRASSLIDAGKSNALPHDEVESSEFYKHIESEGMTEPRRMRQLLMWCGARALGDKPSFEKGDGNAILAAREIQSQLLKDFSTKSSLSDWFGRRESTPPPIAPKANPKNLSNLAKIHELEQQIAQLQEESQTWQILLRPPSDSSIRLPPVSMEPVPPSAIDSSLLKDPNQKAALSALHSFAPEAQPTLATTTSNRLQKIIENIEFEVDKFATNVHGLECFKNTAEQLADDTLATTAETLERRDKEGTRRAVGKDAGETNIRSVLRGLSRIIDR